MNDMAVMISTVKNNNVLTLDLGVTESGRAIYRVYWWNGKCSSETYYRKHKEAYATYKMIERMI